MLTPFRTPALLPPVEDHGNRMGLSLTVGSQIAQQGLARHLRMQAHPAADPARLSQEIVPVNDHMKCHGRRPYRSTLSLSISPSYVRTANPLDNGAYI